MATAKLTIVSGKIVDYRDPYFESLSGDGKKYVGNGWVVEIKDGRKDCPGRVVCHSRRVYSDGPAVCHREFKLADGIIGLAGGNVHSRYAYFRTPEFCKWLKDRDIQCVKHEDPNRMFYSGNPVSCYWSHDLKIETDGEVQEYSYEEHKYQISGATYAVIRQHYADGTRWYLESGVLYTMRKEVTTIDGIKCATT